MTQKEKNLLLKDLCSRLPYGVKCRENKLDSQICTLYPEYIKFDNIERYEPYLRSLSSMNEEEKWKLVKMLHFSSIQDEDGNEIRHGIHLMDEINGELFLTNFDYDVIDWLNAHHFDYRGLIEKGLAVAITKENNPYKK